jgi:non-heme chloroperoxidase
MSVSIQASALLSSKLIPNATLKVYEDASHGLATSHKDRLNEDLLASIKG